VSHFLLRKISIPFPFLSSFLLTEDLTEPVPHVEKGKNTVSLHGRKWKGKRASLSVRALIPFMIVAPSWLNLLPKTLTMGLSFQRTGGCRRKSIAPGCSAVNYWLLVMA
jgi:hypothetical protein